MFRYHHPFLLIQQLDSLFDLFKLAFDSRKSINIFVKIKSDAIYVNVLRLINVKHKDIRSYRIENIMKVLSNFSNLHTRELCVREFKANLSKRWQTCRGHRCHIVNGINSNDNHSDETGEKNYISTSPDYKVTRCHICRTTV